MAKAKHALEVRAREGDAIEKALPGEVDALVGTYGNSVLSQLVEVVKVGKDASVDFRLTNNPFTTSTARHRADR